MRLPFVSRREGERVAVPAFTDCRSMGSVPSFTPAASPRVHRSFPRGLPVAIGCNDQERSLHGLRRDLCCFRPVSPRFELVDESRGLEHWFTCVAPSHLACTAPAVGSSADPLRCQGCLPARRACPRLTCPLLLGTAATVPGGSLNPHGQSAPRGAQPTSSQTSSAGCR